ncbi:adrenocorticotropic hormone receptor [Lingula anatina]|uniref:Adrenocorticotropic hormone receptor n=1 Tax=Lingula anatina TaxID=7574 RepID=A0A1S3I058_LINAN|nr:adrenocorticotropic hormone receptor [Lingula anatina]XP_013391644.1 adrenocorticotropic hormone receptor [Lingula anatina]|eukprot:XP_013391643.1 adrenocorticotropic hormone receptor [Lingula anatina]
MIYFNQSTISPRDNNSLGGGYKGQNASSEEQYLETLFTNFVTAGTVLASIGIVENFISLLALLNMPPPRRAFGMLLINLAVCDLTTMILAAIPGLRYQFDKDVLTYPCRTVEIMEISYVFLLNPVFATLGLVICQYLSVTKPVYFASRAAKRHTNIFICLAWMVTPIIGFLVHLISDPLIFIGQHSLCSMYNNSQQGHTRYYLVKSVTFSTIYVTVAILVGWLYYNLYWAAKPSLELTLAHQPHHERQPERCVLTQHQQLKKTISFLVGTMLFFWLPGTADLYMVLYMQDTNEGEPLCKACYQFHQAANLLFLANALIDPWIYGIRLRDVRMGYQKLFSCFRRRKLRTPNMLFVNNHEGEIH